MKLMINGQAKEVKANLIAELLDELDYCAEKIAVAINGEFVSRSDYKTQPLNEDDAVDILSAVQGG